MLIPLCAAARSGMGGGDANNNSRAMTYVDVDGDAYGKTFNSSSAALSLPARGEGPVGGPVLGWAVASRRGREESEFVFDGKEAPNPGARNEVKLRPPGGTGYVSLSSEIYPVDAAGAPKPAWAAQGPRIYQGFATSRTRPGVAAAASTRSPTCSSAPVARGRPVGRLGAGGGL